MGANLSEQVFTSQVFHIFFNHLMFIELETNQLNKQALTTDCL
jgi:hypothetical protein